jgi:hypothetical protein
MALRRTLPNQQVGESRSILPPALTSCNSHQPPRHPRPRGMTASNQLSNYGDVQTGTHPARRDPDRRSIRTQGRRPSLLRDEEVKSINRTVAAGVPRTCPDRARSSVTHGYPRSLLSCRVTKVAQSTTRLDVFQGDHATSTLVALRPPAVTSRLRSLTVASPQPVKGPTEPLARSARRVRSGRQADAAGPKRYLTALYEEEDDHDTPGR